MPVVPTRGAGNRSRTLPTLGLATGSAGKGDKGCNVGSGP